MTYNDTAGLCRGDRRRTSTEGLGTRREIFEIIASELGWNEQEIEGAAVAGYLHDG
jgi:hypothetical protein